MKSKMIAIIKAELPSGFKIWRVLAMSGDPRDHPVQCQIVGPVGIAEVRPTRRKTKKAKRRSKRR